MKVHFSRITKWSALAGLVSALLADLDSFLYGLGIDVLRGHAELLIWICPFSAGFMSLEHAARSEVAEVYLVVAALNTLLYGALGLVISQTYILIKRSVQPKTA